MSINNRRRLRARLERVATALAKRGPLPDSWPVSPQQSQGSWMRNVSRLLLLVDQECGNN